MTPELEYLRRLIEAATRGPWTNAGGSVRAIASVAWCGEAVCVGSQNQVITVKESKANAALIATLRNIAPAVLELLSTGIAWQESYRTSEPDEQPAYDYGDVSNTAHAVALAVVLKAIREQMPQPPYPMFCHHPDRPNSPPDRGDVTDEDIVREAERLLDALSDEDWLEWLHDAVNEAAWPTSRKDIGMAEHDKRQNRLCAQRQLYVTDMRRCARVEDYAGLGYLIASCLRGWARLAAEESLHIGSHDDDSDA